MDFDLWLGVSGGFKGVPLRIQLQPRWWLRLRLDLDTQNSRTADVSLTDAIGGQDAPKSNP